MPFPTTVPAKTSKDDDDDELYPGMDDADYSAQLQYQTQSKADLKLLMDNFSQEQHNRFEAYRRSALNKGTMRKVIQSLTGQQVSQPVAQAVAGFSKVFVGEIIERARQAQARSGQTGPLSPDHLREAYRMYQLEKGAIGTAKPLKGKKLFVR
ncbi:TAFII28-domain-containing protein [Sistotremastrum suecicum HHB10207 ss-3]|uniref:Transcription initiation factor TFIID subunit 11 n=1 Tax=Sistotremastrum suecicum HHB10207 ss-3 TaxID=1314776 RepID=A0A166DD14_9AGAM|nr:TAFII28-domain-containing protein [Sistotremastrum suecicum HHB10207 ss-3]